MFNPFFETSGLTDKQLMEKINEVSVRISSMRSVGMEYDLVKSMYHLIDACEEELRTREAKKALDATKKQSNTVFDLDEYLNVGEKNKVESTRKQSYKPGW